MHTELQPGTSPEDRFVSTFELNEGHTLNGSPGALTPLRREAIDAFRLMGLPSRKNEAWKYTNIEKALRHEYTMLLEPTGHTVEAADVDAQLLPGLDAHIVAVVNGHLEPALSRIGDLPKGVVISGLAEAGKTHSKVLDAHLGRYAGIKDDALVALNTAFAQDGVFLYVPRGVVVDRPIHLVRFVESEKDVLLHPRNLIVVEEGAQVRVIDTDAVHGPARTMTNVVTEIFVGARANARYSKIQNEGELNSQVNSTHVYQQDNSVFTTTTLTFGGAVVRNNITIVPDGEHCESHMFGLVLGTGEMHVDNHTLMDHAKPNCYSNELYKHVLADNARGVFNGKVFVQRNAQKTNAYQSNKTIILNDTAKMYSKPELEIYADDVKCSHGATTGQLDAEAVFYLRARGLTEKAARRLLLFAFVNDVVDTIEVEPLRDHVDDLVARRFGV
jgi:Fe-S cluster assembly protein SufD